MNKINLISIPFVLFLAWAISVGRDNSYGHPDQQFISELIKRKIQVWRTDQSGGISLATPNKIRVTGKEWWQLRWG